MKQANRIAFGSCNDQDLRNNLWPIIESRKPAAFIWGGDAIYADSHMPMDWSSFPPKSKLECATPQRLNALYQKQRSSPGYRRLLDLNLTIFGTFDDHDYGCNNADRTYEFKYESGLAYVNFLGQPRHSAMSRRAHAGLGVYGVKLFDFSRPDGQQEVPETEAGIDPDAGGSYFSIPSYSNQTVAVFVLDVRTNKTPWKKGSEAYKPDLEGDFLGERQWKWFEKALRRSKAAVNVVVNGLQVHANKFPDGNVAEAWSRYPRAQQRLFDALLQDGVQSPILISGDIHQTQFMRKDCVRKGDDISPPRSLVEMTTSGMTHSWGTVASPPLSNLNQRPSWKERYKSFVAGSIMQTMHFVCPWTDLIASEQMESADGLFPLGGGEGARKGLQFSLSKNFGELEFHWSNRSVSMRAIGEKPDGAPLLMAKMSMDALSGRSAMPGGRVTSQDFQLEANLRNPLIDNEWICINHRGRDDQLSHMLGHITTFIALTALFPIPLLLPSLTVLVLLRRRQRISSSTLKCLP